MLMCLVYVSRAVRPMDEEALLVLLRQSRRDNECAGITGLLLYMGGCFMQALEGEREAVLSLYGRIAADPRHEQVTTLIKFAIPARHFPDWSMGFADIDKVAAEDRAGFSPFLHASLDDRSYRDSPHQAMRLLERFRERMGPRPELS